MFLMPFIFTFSFPHPSSDGWTTADLVFLWKEGDPVQVVKNLHLPRFTLEKFLTDYCNSKTNTGKNELRSIASSLSGAFDLELSVRKAVDSVTRT